MSQFPLTYNEQDSDAAVDALNYVLSGPSGLGQNFSGLSGYNNTFLTGNFRPPFVIASISVNSLGGDTAFTLLVDSVEGIKEGYFVNNAAGTIGTGAVVAVGGIDADTRTITVTVANSGPVSGLVTFYEKEYANLYVAPIAITTITWLSPFNIRIDYAAQPAPPFELGNNVRVSGSSVPIYDYFYTGAGVIECTTTYTVVKSTRSIANPGVGAGGTVTYTNTIQPPVGTAVPAPNDWISTDCIANATVTGATDRVFISGQIRQRVRYNATTNSFLRVTCAINRYRVINIGNVNSPDLRTIFDKTIAQKSDLFIDLLGIGSLDLLESVFNTFIDQPAPGFYSYRLELLFRVVNTTGNMQVTRDSIDVRTLSSQVVKQ
jgi:hypothetical protein